MSETNVSTQQPTPGQAPRLSSSHVDTGRAGHHQGAPPQGAPPPVGLIWRVERRDTFEALRRARRRRQGALTVSWVPGDPSEPPRVAFTIGRRVGPAVVRNRLRRRLRMLMRQAAPLLRPGAYMIGASPEATSLSFSELEVLVSRIIKSVETQ